METEGRTTSSHPAPPSLNPLRTLSSYPNLLSLASKRPSDHGGQRSGPVVFGVPDVHASACVRVLSSLLFHSLSSLDLFHPFFSLSCPLVLCAIPFSLTAVPSRSPLV